jgi:hypothetical protein
VIHCCPSPFVNTQILSQAPSRACSRTMAVTASCDLSIVQAIVSRGQEFLLPESGAKSRVSLRSLPNVCSTPQTRSAIPVLSLAGGASNGSLQGIRKPLVDGPGGRAGRQVRVTPSHQEKNTLGQTRLGGAIFWRPALFAWLDTLRSTRRGRTRSGRSDSRGAGKPRGATGPT